MLRINNITQAHAQRTLRANYAHTQGTPYAAYLSPVLADGTTPFVKGSGSVPGTAGQGPILAGQVAAWAAVGETVHVSVGGTTFAPAGLFGNNVGGDFDELWENNEVAVWYGPGSVWEILSPVFNSNITAADEATAADRLLYADANGKLNDSAVSGGPAVAQLQDWVSASKIVVMLKV
jgi:hypothetical protein